MKQAILLYNRAAGRGNFERKIDSIIPIFNDAGYSMRAVAIDFDDNPFKDCHDVDLAVVAGGDGTLNYIVNAMMRQNLCITLGILPTGTANDFAGALGMSNNIIKAARQIASGSVQAIDCGRVEQISKPGVPDIYFVNIFSFGIFTTTSQHTPEELKHIMGRAAYMIEGFKELKRLHGIPLTITTNNEAFYYPTLIGLVFNGETAGRVPLARMASLNDGVLDCLFLRKRETAFQSACDMLLYILGIKTRAVKYIRTGSLTLMTPTSETTDVDGQMGGGFPMRLSCIPGGLKFICPREN